MNIQSTKKNWWNQMANDKWTKKNREWFAVSIYYFGSYMSQKGVVIIMC